MARLRIFAYLPYGPRIWDWIVDALTSTAFHVVQGDHWSMRLKLNRPQPLEVELGLSARDGGGDTMSVRD